MENIFRKGIIMKNSLIRRSVTGVLAVAMVFSAYSCSSKKNEESKKEATTQTAQTANEVIENSYSSIDIDVEIPADYIEQMLLVKDTSKVLILGGSDEVYSLYLTDMDFSGFSEIPLDFPKTENSQSYLRTAVSPDGYIYALFTLIDYGDFKLPDYDDPNFDYENFDFEAMNKAAEYSCTLYKLSSDGKVVSENPIENLDEYVEDSEYGIHINNLVAGKDGNLVISLSGEEENYLILNENGKISGKIEAEGENHWINYFATDSKGNIVCTGYGNTGEIIEYIDMDAKKFVNSKIDISGENQLGINSINTGTGEYTLFMGTQTGLYGVGEDKKPVELINWVDSDIKGDSVQHVIGLEDGDFIVYIRDYESDTSGFARLTKRSADELANQTVITVGMLYNDSAITSKITEFNKSNSQYRIKISDYSKYDIWDEETEKMTNTAEKQLKMDIVSGKAPDMIVTYSNGLISELASKGTYTDLYTYLEKDGDLSKDDIMPNVLKASEIDGKLYSLSPSFDVNTFACKSKFFDKENWTLDDLIDTFHDNPDMQLTNSGNSKEMVFELLVNTCCDEFIDYEKAECHFDSDEFKKILEFCNEFPDEDEEIDWETASNEEMLEYWNEQETMCLNDKALLSNVGFYDFTAYAQAKAVTFGDDITLVGFPSDDGKGALISMNTSMAILDSSPSKDACWEFIKSFFNDEYMTKTQYIYGLPSLVSAFEKKAEESMHKPYYMDENGKKVEYDNTYIVNDKEITIDPLTKEEKDFVVDYIKKADKVHSGYSEEIREMIVEEVTKYFKGEATSQQAIDKLQSRVGILLSEQS